MSSPSLSSIWVFTTTVAVVVIVEFDNSQLLLRELYRVRDEKHLPTSQLILARVMYVCWVLAIRLSDPTTTTTMLETYERAHIVLELVNGKVLN